MCSPSGSQDAVIVPEGVLGDVHLPLGSDLEEVDLRVLVQVVSGVDQPTAVCGVLGEVESPVLVIGQLSGPARGHINFEEGVGRHESDTVRVRGPHVVAGSCRSRAR